MKKLNMVIRYECSTTFKSIWIFYAIQYLIVMLLMGIVYLSVGNQEGAVVGSMEMNSMIFTAVLGVLGVKEDFRMLIQNGFTRSYIFLGTLSMFAFVAGIMAAFDTLAASVLYSIFGDGYGSMFGGLYGAGQNVILNWLWLFLSYVVIACLAYLITLVIQKLGKLPSILLGVTAGFTVILVLPVLFRFVLPQELTKTILEALMKGFGFMRDGTINLAYPVVMFLVLGGVIGTGSYLVMRRTELNG